ncbi:MAG: OmpA family protein [Gammaproteobacteria bacterium]
MNRNHGNLNVALLPGLILAAIAAGGWYYYYSELDKNQSLEKNNESVQRELNQELEQQQNTIDQLTQTERELQASLALEIELQEQLQASFEAIKVEKEQKEISMQQEANRVASTTAELEKELQQRQARQKSLEDNISRVSGEKSQLTGELEQEQNKRQQLQQQIANIVDDVGQKEKALAYAEFDVSQLNQELETTRREQNLLVADIEELNRQRNKDSEHFANLKRRLEQELNQSQVEIAQLKNQMTVIKLTDDVLFSSGSADIKADGKKVLSLIAESLNAYPDRAISIEGHTDHVPIGNNPRYASNWELSSMRALAALNYFQQNSQVDPNRLKLVGYGEYRPAYSNATAEGRKRNRRIEIIILPPESALAPQN